MFEAAELGHTIDERTFERDVPALREALVNAQYDLSESKTCAVAVLVNGVDGAGKGETVNLLNTWMDPRFIRVHGIGQATDEERQRPELWRFWRILPPRGRISFLMGSWYTQPILDRAYGRIGQGGFERALQALNRFEKMLSDEGVLLLKLWFHLSKKRQKARLEALAKDSDTRWRVTKTDWEHFRRYDRFVRVCGEVLRATSTAEAPWLVVDGSDWRYRSVTVARTMLEAIRGRLKAARRPPSAPRHPVLLPALDGEDVIARLDLTRALPKKSYQRKLEKQQGRLALLTRHRRFARLPVVVVFEGFDAAGKGSAIRRVTEALDARLYEIVPISAPSEEERAQPYLWRFWRHLPRRGAFTVFDRSWYGRVLVERVEGLCAPSDWARAYGEINDFEEQLVAHGTVLVKFWMHVSADEQLRRFKERQTTSFKRFKITREDWRNREKRPAYEAAVGDMVARTSTDVAPWTLVEAEDKPFARVKVLKTLCDRLEAAL
jgi:polyphosphate:AMP phosphotransferase